MQPLLISPRQAAQLKGVSRAAVYAAIKDGRLASQMIAGHLVLSEADVLAWIPVTQSGKRRSSPMSDEVKKRISASQTARWTRRRHQDLSSED
jgi:excisionase family DNA binding protein